MFFFFFSFLVFFFFGKLGLFGVFLWLQIYLSFIDGIQSFFFSESEKKFYSERSIDVISIVCEQFNKIH